MTLSPARRVPTVHDIERAGDYSGPHHGYTGDGRQAVFFLLPIAQRPAPLNGRGPADRLHHVTAPPHVFRECADGSLEVRESIGSLGESDGPYIWCGYLQEGNVWERVA